MEIYSLTTCEDNVPTTIIATTNEDVWRLLSEHYSKVWDDLQPPHEAPESVTGMIETLRDFDLLRDHHEVYIETHKLVISE